MSRIEFPGKSRKDAGAGQYWTDKDGSRVFIGRDYALQNDIDEKIAERNERACFKGCRTCGACSNSARDATYPKMYDANEGKMIDCRACEPYRYHDCHNGVMRNTRQDAEPFTQDQIDLIELAENKRPLI